MKKVKATVAHFEVSLPKQHLSSLQKISLFVFVGDSRVLFLAIYPSSMLDDPFFFHAETLTYKG